MFLLMTLINSKNIKIRKILQTFIHHNRYYIVFQIEHYDRDFLYLIHRVNDIYALFYGKHLNLIVSKFKNDPNIECIECNLGTKIKGGVAWDSGDLTHFNLDKMTANKILKELKEMLPEIPYPVKLFRISSSQGVATK